jgi:hypothetical protein
VLGIITDVGSLGKLVVTKTVVEVVDTYGIRSMRLLKDSIRQAISSKKRNEYGNR